MILQFVSMLRQEIWIWDKVFSIFSSKKNVALFFCCHLAFTNHCPGSPKFNLVHSATVTPTKPYDKPNNYTNVCRKHNFSTKKMWKYLKKKITDALLVFRANAPAIFDSCQKAASDCVFCEITPLHVFILLFFKIKRTSELFWIIHNVIPHKLPSA